jgi:hypothetical protein
VTSQQVLKEKDFVTVSTVKESEYHAFLLCFEEVNNIFAAHRRFYL